MADRSSKTKLAESRLLQHVEQFVSNLAGDERVLVGFSGGLDSTVLLHALHRVTERLAAVHVDHQLQAESSNWAQHCRRVAESIGIDCAVLAVDAAAQPGDSPEAAARAARYKAWADFVAPDQLLVTAHHADDQLETLLLRLLRGAGVRGMSGIRTAYSGEALRVHRPLLSLTRADLALVAADWRLSWIDDPSNDDQRFDRNFVRASVLPAMTARWPGAGAAAVRLAAHMNEAEGLLGELAEIDLGECTTPDRFPVDRLMALTPARRGNLLRYLIRSSGLPVP